MKELASLVLLTASCFAAPAARVTGELRQWHRIGVLFRGPQLSEQGQPNPFLDYRLVMTFTHAASGRSWAVPGHWAADGNAAETSATAGDVWRAWFTPNQAGVWTFRASFRHGPSIALSQDPNAGTPAAFDGASGRFTIHAAARDDRGFYGKGRLEYVGAHYLRFAGSGEYFLKGGADSPENFLAYDEFDGTFDTDAAFNEGRNNTGKPFLHHYAPHARDWKPGDPQWRKGKGRNIIGALNYLASKGVNSVYFLTYNIDGGDGKDVWPWIAPDVRDRFDVSKLDQWEIVFSQMDALGIQLHVVTQETENDRTLGGSAGLNPVRRLYLRELASRFSHHLAVMWNLGEENNTPDPDRKEIAARIRSLDAYAHPITVHTHNNQVDTFYNGILGNPYFEATSIQGDMKRYWQWAVSLRARSAAAGRKWAIFGDEQPSADAGVVPDADDPNHNTPRIEALWGNLLGGGSGVEWYFGYKYPNMDLNCEDFRSRDRMWDQTRYALQFFQAYLPFQEMEPRPDLSEPAGGRVFAKPGQVYAVQSVAFVPVRLRLDPGTYTVRWFNPRTGGTPVPGNVRSVKAEGVVSLGLPPEDEALDWIALVTRERP
jgi:hypothetical protein